MPLSIPFSAADSEFLYGYSVVVAALKAHKREFRKIYIHPRALKRPSEAKELQRLAREKMQETTVRFVDDRWYPVMNKMAADRPHNVRICLTSLASFSITDRLQGVILETSPLPKWRASALQHPDTHETDDSPHSFKVSSIDSRERRASTNLRSSVSCMSDGWRKPFVLLIDDVVCPSLFDRFYTRPDQNPSLTDRFF